MRRTPAPRSPRPRSGRTTPMTVTTWRTDPAHTDIQFSAKHMMVTTVRGKFADVDGSLTLDETDPAASSGSFTVRAGSLSTGNEQRDGHLRSADFFDAETHPRSRSSPPRSRPSRA